MLHRDYILDLIDQFMMVVLEALRHAQAEAVAESFGCDLQTPPEGLEGLAN